MIACVNRGISEIRPSNQQPHRTCLSVLYHMKRWVQPLITIKGANRRTLDNIKVIPKDFS